MKHPNRLRRMGGISMAATLLTGGVAFLALHGCDSQLPGDEACRDVGYSIANKVFECTGEVDKANDAYERFMDGHTCLLKEEGTPSATQFKCSQKILLLTCDQVAAYGDDYDRWMGNAAAECSEVYLASDGGVLPEGEVPVEAGVEGGDATVDGSDGGIDVQTDVADEPVETHYLFAVYGTVDGKPTQIVCQGSLAYDEYPANPGATCKDVQDDVTADLTVIKAEKGIFDGAEALARVSLSLTFVASWTGAPTTVVVDESWTNVKASVVEYEKEPGGVAWLVGNFWADHAAQPATSGLNVSFEFKHVPCESACP